MLYRTDAAKVNEWLARWGDERGWPLAGDDHLVRVAEAYPGVTRVELDTRPGTRPPDWWPQVLALLKRSFDPLPVSEWPPGEAERAANTTLANMPPTPPPTGAPESEQAAYEAELAAWRERMASWAPTGEAETQAQCPWDCVKNERDRDLVRLWCEGLTAGEIATRLRDLGYYPIQSKTVTNRVTELRTTFGPDVVPYRQPPENRDSEGTKPG